MLARRIIVATGNAHKVEELTSLLASHGLSVELIPLSSVAPDLEIDETGSTFEENAYIKAALVHAATGMPALADDSGLEVAALDGAPGVRSARYSGADATDATNRALLLERMRHVDERAAAFRCVLCYVDDQHVLFGEGSCSGSMAHEERGTNGFGYDPLFIGDGDDRSFAQLSPDEKHARSHRGAAVADLARRVTEDAADDGVDDRRYRDDLLRACVAAGLGDDTLLARALRGMHDATTATMMYEALLQCYLFAGFPAALDALGTWFTTVQTRGLLGEAPSAATIDVPLFETRGEVLCRQVYGSVYDRMMQRLGQVSPDLRTWMLVEGYGKTLSRSGLSMIDRELCIVAILAALGRHTQLFSHVRGALRAGAALHDLQDVVDVVTETCGHAAGDRIRSVLQDVSV
ncbi:MAG: RdgB/HAM1 family non-canonical purine NTP pyrophosphatase [Candidatus Kapabacteria bacterium]|nr:RdgB/HAM1 family non-canonical purine NTP pyrophosphatase [Candidatus Kapabacteria bacterium]